MAEIGTFDMSLDDFLNLDKENEGFVDFDIDPSIFDDNMELPMENKAQMTNYPASEPVPTTPVTYEKVTNEVTEIETLSIQPNSKFPDRNDIDKFIGEQENKNTMRKTLSDVKKLQIFLNERRELRQFYELDMEELDEHIASFLMSAKKPDGTEYETSTMRNMVSSFDRKLHRHAYPHSIMGNTNAFSLTKQTLKAKLKVLKKGGKGNRPFEAEAITDEDINVLYEKGLLGANSPEAIINTLWLNNSIHFGMRGVSEHYNLCWGDVTLKQDGYTEYLELNERQTKTRTGENVGNIRKIKPKTFSNETARNPVEIYKLYTMQRPSGFSHPDSPYYLAPRTVKAKTNFDQMFLRQRIGLKKMSNLIKSMCDKAGISGKRLTNHSARKHLVQKLRDANIPPTEIMQITGHKNVQSVVNYSSISNENQKRCSTILGNHKQRSNPPATLGFNDSVSERSVALNQSTGLQVSSPSMPPSHQIPAMNFTTTNNTVSSQIAPFFYGAVLNVGSINFYQCHGPKSPK